MPFCLSECTSTNCFRFFRGFGSTTCLGSCAEFVLEKGATMIIDAQALGHPKDGPCTPVSGRPDVEFKAFAKIRFDGALKIAGCSTLVLRAEHEDDQTVWQEVTFGPQSSLEFIWNSEDKLAKMELYRVSKFFVEGGVWNSSAEVGGNVRIYGSPPRSVIV